MRLARVVVAASGALACAALLTGCGPSAAADGPDAGRGAGVEGGFVAGDGSLVVLAESERKQAPALAGQTLDGEAFSLADHFGEVVVLNVWASWCAPCRAEAPTLVAVSDAYEGRGVQFVGLDTRDSDVSARAFESAFGVTYPSLVDRDGRLQLLFADSLPPQAIPSTVVIDRQGRVAARALGRVSESSLRGMIEPLLTESPAASPADKDG